MKSKSKYSDEIAFKICELIATTEKGIHRICEENGMPSPSTVFKWLTENQGFSDKYARAKEMQADFLADQIIKISDESRIGIKKVEKPSGTEITSGDMVERSKLQVDARKWKASKLYPQKYGTKLDVTSNGETVSTAKSFIKLPDGTEIEI